MGDQGGDEGRAAGVPTPSRVTTVTEGSTATLSVRGVLDGSLGVSLLEAARRLLRSGAERLDVDLQGVAGFTPQGAAALLACRDLGSGLPRGVHYRTGAGAGGEALLTAYEAEAGRLEL